jgi:hypothetical protein
MATPLVLPIIPLNTEGQELSFVDESNVSSISVPSSYDVETDYIQAYLYDENDLLISRLTTNYSITSGKISGSSSTELNLDPAQDLASNNYTQGIYKINYNFLSNLISANPTFNVVEISSDRTELRISNSSLNSVELQAVANTLTDFLNSTEVFQGFELDFGNDTLLLVTNVGFDGTAVLIKLYQELPQTLGVKSNFFFVKKKSEPVAFRVEYPQEEVEAPQQIYLKGPNLNIQAQQETNNSTEFQTISTIYGSSSTNLTNQLNSILAERRAELNTDYTDYINFVFFSSAEQRLINFYEKASLIENYTNQIASLNTLPNTTEASSSKAVYQTKINDLITNFDGYDYFLYFNSESKSWPKSNSTQPYTLYSTGSSQVLNWYSFQLTTASLYDEQNQNYIYNIYPQYIVEDSDNDQFKLFNEMVAQMFDQIWLYTQAIENRQDGDNRLSEGISIDLAADALRSYGITLYESNFSNNDLYTTYLGINPGGGTLPPTGSELITTYVTASAETTPFNDAQKLVYKRLYHNLPYLLKKKGTVAGLQLLIDCFGVPDTLLRIYEYGGKDKNTATFDQWQQQYDLAFTNTGSSYVTSSFVLNSTWAATSNRPSAVEFKFKTGGIPSSSYYSQSLWSTNNGVTVLLKYTGSAFTSGSYSGSVANPYNQYGVLEFYPSSSNLNTTASIYLPFFDGGWWSVLVNKDSSTAFTVYAKNNIYTGNDGNILGFQGSSSVSLANPWTAATEAYLGKSSISSKIFSGSLQELRYYTQPISESTFDAYVMNPSSIEQSEYLAFRASLGGELYTASISIHPKVSGEQVTTSSFSATSNFYITGSATYTPNTQVVFYDQVLGGIKNIVSEKIKIQDSTVYGKVLSGLASLQQNYPASQSYTSDVNYMEVGFSPANEINEDINSQLGYVNIGEYIGDPRSFSQDSFSYPTLTALSSDYFKKYGSSYDLQDYFRLIKYFDNSLFKMIKDFVPARTSAATGAIVKQHLLERNRQRPAQLDYTQPEYTGSVTSLARDYQTGSIEVFTGGAGGSVNVLTNISQSWTSSILTKAGLVTEIESSQYEFFNGEYSGSVIDVVKGKLQDNPLLGANFRVNISDQQNLAVQSAAFIASASLFDGTFYYSTGSIRFNNLLRSIDYYNTSTYKYTPNYSVQADIVVTVTGSIISGSQETGEFYVYLYADGSPVASTSYYTTSSNQQEPFTLTLTVPNYYLSSGSTYEVRYRIENNFPLATTTASINTNTSWTVSVDNLFAQSTYYLDPTVYTQQNFPGDINDYSDYNSLLNNVYSNRVSNQYFDVDYSQNALNPVNFGPIVSQSAIYAQVQDSNYTTGSAWSKGRYEGTKLQTYNSESAVNNYTDYFLYFSSITSQTPDLSLIPYGGNVRGVALINTNGDVISLTPDNQNIGLIQQIFGVFDTVKAIFPTQYLGTDVSDLTLTIIIAGGVQNYLETNNILTSTPNETNIFLGVVDSQPASISTLNTAIFSDSAGYLIPANFNVNYLSKISDIAKQAGFPIN